MADTRGREGEGERVGEVNAVVYKAIKVAQNVPAQVKVQVKGLRTLNSLKWAI